MKKFFLAMALALLVPSMAYADGEGFDADACTYNGIPLYGRVQIVDSFPDIRVKVVDSFPDVKVKKVDSFPDSCGEWKFVDSFPDVKIKLVDSSADIKIKYVDSFPGTN